VARDEALAAHLSAAAQGSVKAFEAFYDTMVGHAQALARRMVRPPDVADVLSDAFFQAWRDASHFDPARGSAATWLLTIVHSRALDLLRRQRAQREVDPGDEPLERPDPAPGPDELLANLQQGTRLHTALAELTPNERWVLGLAYYRDLSHSEICDVTGLPLGTVKSAIRRAQAKLRDQLTS
jgi:RNA polymerase sigma-70 factor (ECF subfamily)